MSEPRRRRRSAATLPVEWLAAGVLLLPLLHTALRPPESWIAEDLRVTQAERLCREVALARTDFHERHGRWPTGAEVAAPPADPWGRPLHLQIDATQYVNVRCDGRDGRPGTGDDIVDRRPPTRRSSP